MNKTLRSPQTVYTFAMWLVTLVFAGFLIGLGDKIIDDLRIAKEPPTLEDFADPGALRSARARIAGAQAGEPALDNEAAQASARSNQARTAYESAKSSFDAWIATRRATGDAARDPEVLSRTNDVVQLRTEQERRQQAVLDVQRRRAQQQQALAEARRDEARLLQAGRPAFEQAVRWRDLAVFGVRLAFTLPLLLIAAWFVARKRGSRYWPLMRGFVIAAAFAFFFELVPYLPSYGGYVRYAVGIVITLVAGQYGIRWMQGYLQRRQEEELRSETDRRAHLDNEQALLKMKSDLCPGCERPILTTGDIKPNFCCHCGLKLFDTCGTCQVRKNAYFKHCMVCGALAHPPLPAEAPAQAVPRTG